MRRFIFVLILLSLMLPIIAVDSEIKSVPVFFAGNDTAIDFGFSSNIITRVTDEPEELVDNKISFILNPDGSSSTGTFFLWWKIYSSARCTISLTGTSLKNGNTEINWTNNTKINNSDFTTRNEMNNSVDANVEVIVLDNNTKPIAGSQPLQLNIYEEDLEKSLGDITSFSGTLTVTVRGE